MLPEITRPVLSYCNIPQDITEDHWISEFMCGCHVELEIQVEEDPDVDTDILYEWIKENYPELIGKKFFIEIDY